MSEFSNNGCFKEAVCIEAMRIFDSCSDKDCLEDLEVTFTSAEDRAKVERANYIKAKCVEVINATFTIDAIPFNKGFFTVDITYTFKVDIETSSSSTSSSLVSGLATFCKKVILYGSDGSTKNFSSDEIADQTPIGCCCSSTKPRASVSVVEPIILDAKLVCKYPAPHQCHPKMELETDGYTSQGNEYGNNCCPPKPVPCCVKKVLVTIGMFSIVQLSRPVPILIPAYDYCIPDKGSSTNTDSPCELFDKIKFPTSEFYPKSLDDTDGNCDCQSSNTEY